MYYRYFGLREEPFSIAVNPRYLFMSARHRDALAHLLYGVGAGGGFILLTGEVGTGKTTINRCLLEQLPGNTDIAIILNPALDADELLATACDEFGIDYDRERSTLKDLTDRLHAFLLNNHREGRNTVLLIDEAQHLKFETLEQIRLLTNLETNTRKLLQIILVGQPELAAMLAKPELRQLSQRITARYNLEPLNLKETDAYIRHRLQVAGLPGNQELFPPRVVKQIYRTTRGIPRLINVLCDRVLLGSYGQNQSQVSMKMLRQAIDEVMGEELDRGDRRRPWPLLAAAAALALAAVGAWYFAPAMLFPADSAVSEPPPATVAPARDPAVDIAAAIVPDRQLALATLASHIGLELGTGREVCNSLARGGWRCEALGAASWQDLLEFDSPVVLTLVTPERFLRYGVLVAVDGDTGVLQAANQRYRVALKTLGPLWRGDFELIWQPPEQYVGPVSLGDRGPMVTWLADTFATLDGQARPLAGEEFNAALDARVRLFQRRFNLQDDGVVGLKTLLKLNAVIGDGATLLPTSAEIAQLGEG